MSRQRRLHDDEDNDCLDYYYDFDDDDDDDENVGTPPTAWELSSRLAGTDEIVKEFFFNLSPKDRKGILDKYELQYGRGKRKYAEKVVENWKTGRTAMSGKIAARLFDLLPPYMPMSSRQKIIDTLWKEYSPKTQHEFVVGLNCGPSLVIHDVKQALIAAAVPVAIPDELIEEFAWLANDDVHIQQQLLHYLQLREAELIVADAECRIPLLLMAAHDQMGLVKSIQQTYTLGNHTVLLHFDANEEGIRAGRPYVRHQYQKKVEGCLTSIILLLVVVCLGCVTAVLVTPQ